MTDDPASTVLPAHPPNPMRKVLSLRDFRLVWIGQATSLLGDQFHFIAAPWLVLAMTGDPLALGLVFALSSIPRAIFMLVGGAITDRFSSRTVMLTSDFVRLGLAALFAVLVFTGQIQVWMILALSLLFGLVGGFFMPAASAIVPALVPPEDLQAGNSITQGTSQLVAFIGPMLAGAVIALWASGASADSAAMKGIGIAFTLDALSFLVSVVTLWMIRARPARQVEGEETGAASVLRSIRAGLKYTWDSPLLRLLITLIAAVNLVFVGPLLVGIPVIAKDRLPEGAAAFGIIVGAYAGGSLAGTVAAGMLGQRRSLSMLTVVLVASFGVGLAVVGFSTSMWVDVAVMLVLGVGNGYLSIRLFTYIQRSTPPEMLGRMMSLILFANVGLVPISQALSGAVLRWNVTALFVGAAVFMLAIAVWLATHPELKRIDQEIGAAAGTPAA